MAGLFDYERTDEFYDSLPPLVPKGASLEERDRILDEVVEEWAKPLPSCVNLDQTFTTVGVTLYRVGLWDAEREEPIDLGGLVRAVLNRVDSASEQREKPVRAITLLGCRVARCDLANVDFVRRNIRFRASSSSFGEGAVFRGASFGDGADFREASFGETAVFREVSFGERTKFREARFGVGADFREASFGDGADFREASFDEGASFWFASFGKRAEFREAGFGEGALFWLSSFGDGADFRSASFRDGAVFEKARFGYEASFAAADFAKSTLSDAMLNRADLRVAAGQGRLVDLLWPFYRIPFILDHTCIRDTNFHSRSRDPWSVLRRSYTGASMVFILLFTLLAFAPVAGRVVFWSGMSKLQHHAAPLMLRSVSATHELLGAAPEGEWTAWATGAKNEITELQNDPLTLEDVSAVYVLYTDSSKQLGSYREAHPNPVDAIAQKAMVAAGWEEQAQAAARMVAPNGIFKLAPRRVYEVVLGLEHGLGWATLALSLVLYNVARAAMTYQIGPMRDHADQTARSPAWKEYKWLWYAHRALSVMLLLAVGYGAVRLVGMLRLPLLVPG